MEKTDYVEVSVLVPPDFGDCKFNAMHLADMDFVP